MNGTAWKSLAAGIGLLLAGALWTGASRLAVVETQLTGIDGRLFQLERILLYDKAGP